jgi:hypothetical protein
MVKTRIFLQKYCFTLGLLFVSLFGGQEAETPNRYFLQELFQ